MDTPTKVMASPGPASPRKAAWLCIATLAWALVMSFVPGLRIKDSSGFADPSMKSRVLVVELAPDGRTVMNAVPNSEIRHLRINTEMDFVFILLYCSMLLAFADMGRDLAPRVSALLGSLALLAAGADALENFGILSEMRQLSSGSVSDRTAHLTSTFSLGKWTIFYLAIAFLAFVLWHLGRVSRNRIGFTLASMLAAAASVTALYGLANQQPHLIGVATFSLLGPAILLCIPMLFLFSNAMTAESRSQKATLVPCDPDSVIARTAYSFVEVFASELSLVFESRLLRLYAAPLLFKEIPQAKVVSLVPVERSWSAQLISYRRRLAAKHEHSKAAAAGVESRNDQGATAIGGTV